MKTSMRGWNDNELPLYDNQKLQVDIDIANEFFTPDRSPEQLGQGWVTHDWRA